MRILFQRFENSFEIFFAGRRFLIVDYCGFDAFLFQNLKSGTALTTACIVVNRDIHFWLVSPLIIE
ncbi:hypothetical protein THIOM_002396 [Candidatus Thiomargarita nelsonii]|uniref:Uncharacterized protein n=1 Tax=Candidatus Thiomargarita nelsonii TaxID=1003181 RepID=A0A176S177_9GAMM|nr:hypothetical protein THIOM_002396 [Candidatus Thiomargarita nelsonii]